jgi:hypothetical protein
MKENYHVGFFNAKIKDENDKSVPFGNYCWWLRTSSGIPMDTEVELQDHTAYHGFENEFYAEVKDKEGYPVQEGIFCWYVKCIRECKPFVTKTEITEIDVKNWEAFIYSTVKDSDDLNVPDGNICYNLSDLPIDMTIDSSTEIESNSQLYAMIVDKEGVVIDRGILYTTDDNSTYISSDEFIEDEHTVKFKLKEDSNG